MNELSARVPAAAEVLGNTLFDSELGH